MSAGQQNLQTCMFLPPLKKPIRDQRKHAKEGSAAVLKK